MRQRSEKPNEKRREDRVQSGVGGDFRKKSIRYTVHVAETNFLNPFLRSHERTKLTNYLRKTNNAIEEKKKFQRGRKNFFFFFFV